MSPLLRKVPKWRSTVPHGSLQECDVGPERGHLQVLQAEDAQGRVEGPRYRPHCPLAAGRAAARHESRRDQRILRGREARLGFERPRARVDGARALRLAKLVIRSDRCARRRRHVLQVHGVSGRPRRRGENPHSPLPAHFPPGVHRCLADKVEWILPRLQGRPETLR